MSGTKRRTPDLGTVLGGKSEQEGLQDNQEKQEQQSNHELRNKPTTERGLPDEWVRATFITKKSQLHYLKAIAFWRRETVKETLAEALQSYFEQFSAEEMEEALNLYESKKGKQ